MPAATVRTADAKSILTPTSGFIRDAGFTHSLTPARNCTFGCAYCYVPTMRIYGGLKREDWESWGRHTTLKANAAQLAHRELRPSQRIYCSPLVDPYQPAEADASLMPGLLRAVAASPPAVFCLQTRGVMILRDLDILHELATVTTLRISLSITTDREDVRRWYEPHCDTIPARLDAVRRLREAGLETYCTLAPLLPCDPESLVRQSVEASRRDLVLDPLHTRAAKRHGATTRPDALAISATRGFEGWHEPGHQRGVVKRIQHEAAALGFRAESGIPAFAWLARPSAASSLG